MTLDDMCLHLVRVYSNKKSHSDLRVRLAALLTSALPSLTETQNSLKYIYISSLSSVTTQVTRILFTSTDEAVFVQLYHSFQSR